MTKPASSPRAGFGLARRLVWFIAFWAAGVLATGLVGFAIRLALKP
jgi:hypothetical protein